MSTRGTGYRHTSDADAIVDRIGAGMCRMLCFGLDVLGKVWTVPNTLVGLALGLAALPFGARLAIGGNAICILRCPIGRGALTLGNVVLYAGRCTPNDVACMYGDPRPLPVGRHERAHTFQYQVLGPLFLPMYLLAGGISARNPLERAANIHAAGGSWWPDGWTWPRRRDG